MDWRHPCKQCYVTSLTFFNFFVLSVMSGTHLPACKRDYVLLYIVRRKNPPEWLSVAWHTQSIPVRVQKSVVKSLAECGNYPLWLPFNKSHFHVTCDILAPNIPDQLLAVINVRCNALGWDKPPHLLTCWTVSFIEHESFRTVQNPVPLWFAINNLDYVYARHPVMQMTPST